ncbi:hypothetical protein DFH06DRAFT_1016897 [Mycena polygramma]|nr:hypothetical protein DFH06DRAFT_1016897 [Mycena polygramma]
MQWAKFHRDTYLDESIRLEGRGDHRHQTRCANCTVATLVEVVYRCKDCFTDALFCKPCIVLMHKDNPFHCPEMWDGECFVEVTMKSLGLRIQLGHGRNGTGNGDKEKRDDFCVVDSNGIFEVGLDFCSCGLAESHDIQLLRARLFPATSTNPATAATFGVLRQFHMMSLEAKCSAHHFYNSLARKTNNNGVFQPRNRYNEFRRMTREWRNLQMFKRAACGHSVNGIKGTLPGACALLCPACPQPGKNLPKDGSWKKVPRERRFLYALFLAIDANFRMKRKHVSSEADDPSLGNGVAFFSDVNEYMAHVNKHWDLEQESTCVAHDAVNEPDREAYGTASSGIGTVDCARHNMKRPNGVGDLQKGERYINMDYMLWASLQNYDELVELFVSYDIVCQWHKNIWVRLAQYSPKLKQRGLKRGYVWLIPKFHLPAHIEACNILYSFNLTPFVGQTDGEAPERGWANANPLASSTKEMGPGARRDALDDHFNDWNHKKIVGMGDWLLEKAKRAVEKMSTHRLELLEAEDGLPALVVETWTKEMELWELDSKNPNPFKINEKPEGVHAIQGRLAAEASTAKAGDALDDVRGDLHASEMINQGLNLEEQQRELAFDAGALKTHATDRQKTAMTERSNKLGRKLHEWLKTRESFTPIVGTLRAEEEQARERAARVQPTPGVPVHAVKLWLPSRLATRPGVEVKESHARYEFELRVGQAHEALETLRQLLLVRTQKYKYKDTNTRGVGANTRANTAIKHIDERIRRTAAQYRAARQALVHLGPKLGETEWKKKLRILTPDDVRATAEEAAHEAQKRNDEVRPASWIWLQLSEGQEGDDETAMTEALRIEWAKTRARAWRWTEEVDLVEEEMRRVLEFLAWKSLWWLEQIDQRPDVVADEILREGFTAYARRQSRMQTELRSRFVESWKDVPRYIKLGRDMLDTIPEEEGEEVVQADGVRDEDVADADGAVPEEATDLQTVASFVEDSLA